MTWTPVTKPGAGFGAAAVLLAGLAGCGGESVLGLTQIALEGASHLATGKSMSGHGLSAITGEDCDLSRALTGEPVCRAAGTPRGDATIGDAAVEPARSALGAIYLEAASARTVLVEPLRVPAFAEVETPLVYVVVASYRSADEAAYVAAGLRELPAAAAAAASIDGSVFYCVVVGPLDDRLVPVLDARLAAAGITHTFAVELCPGTLGPPPCFSRPRYRTRLDRGELAAAEVR